MKKFCKNSVCVKCGSRSINLQWGDGKVRDDEGVMQEHEHLLCSCLRCAFEWATLPMDAELNLDEEREAKGGEE